MLLSPCILAFDTATGPTSVAVWKDGRVSAYLETTASVVQSARLVPMIEQALKESGTDYKHLTAIACTIGPGSFTGIRIGLATARGICLATGIKGLGFTTLEVVAFAAHKASPKKPILALFNAGKGEHYYQGFHNTLQWHTLCDPQVGTLAAAAAIMPAGFQTAGNASLPGTIASSVTFPRADALAELATRHEPVAALKPFYIRPPDATPLVKNIAALL